MRVGAKDRFPCRNLLRCTRSRCSPRTAEGRSSWEAVEAGWAACKANPDSGWWRRKTTRAHIVWENSVKKAIEVFADDRSVRVVPHYDTVSFIFEDAMLLRFKKAGISLKSSNIQTTLAGMFHDHETDLFGYSGLQRVEVVYVLNRFETEIMWTGIVARENKTHLWHFELEAAPIEVPALVFPTAQTSTAELAKIKDEKRAPDQKKKDGE